MEWRSSCPRLSWTRTDCRTRARCGRSRQREAAAAQVVTGQNLGSGVELAGDRAQHLGNARGGLALGVLALLQDRLNLILEQREHVLDHAVQLVGRVLAYRRFLA